MARSSMLLFVVAVPALMGALRASAAPQFVDPGLDSSTASSIAAQEAEFQAEEAEQAAQGNGLKPRQASQESTAAAAAAADQQNASQAAEAAAAAAAQAQAAAVQSSQQDQNDGAFKRSDSSLVDLD